MPATAKRTPQRLPAWIRRPWASGPDFSYTKELVAGLGLHTVCQSARCPNLAECWQRRTATLMILGNTCTRNCRFCSVSSGHPQAPDVEEPSKVANAIRHMGLRHAVITMVTRDDLDDGGAGHMAATVRAIRALAPGTTIEVLVSDFKGQPEPIDVVLESKPDVFGHNIETVERLYEEIRGRRCTYGAALGVLRRAASHPSAPIVKSALMVGHGETFQEVRQTLEDLRAAGCEAICIGQYLRPGPKQRPVLEFVHEEQFSTYERLARDLGFSFAVAGPFVRSSYRAEELVRAPLAKGRLQAV